MKWIIKIDNQPKARIVINFIPLIDSLSFMGEYKINNTWKVFYEEIVQLDGNTISDVLNRTHEKLNQRIDGYEKISKLFENVDSIEIIKKELE